MDCVGRVVVRRDRIKFIASKFVTLLGQLQRTAIEGFFSVAFKFALVWQKFCSCTRRLEGVEVRWITTHRSWWIVYCRKKWLWSHQNDWCFSLNFTSRCVLIMKFLLGQDVLSLFWKNILRRLCFTTFRKMRPWLKVVNVLYIITGYENTNKMKYNKIFFLKWKLV